MTSLRLIREALIGKDIKLHKYDYTYDDVEILRTDYIASQYGSHGEHIKYRGIVTTKILDISKEHSKEFDDFSIVVKIDDKELLIGIQLTEDIMIQI